MNAEGKKWAERRVPAITLPESEAFSYALVLARNPHGEHFASILGVMDFTISVMEVWTKDELHAPSFFLRINMSHIPMALSSWHATSEPAAGLQQKNPERRSLGSLFLHSSEGRGRRFLRQKIWTC